MMKKTNKTEETMLNNFLNDFLKEENSFLTIDNGESVTITDGEFVKTVTELNIIPYIASAVSYPKYVRDDIEELYEKNKGEFYEYARKSEHFDSFIFKELALDHAFIATKALGILEFIREKMDYYEIQLTWTSYLTI